MKDLDTALELYAMARQFMKDHGNPTQWGDNHPPKEQVIDDIQTGQSYLCTEDRPWEFSFFPWNQSLTMHRSGTEPG